MIPSVFMSWTGEALDKKIPLLRSNAAVNKAAQKVLKLMGETEIATVNSSCGAEQEYFLIDENFANARPDLLLCGRTLFGASPAKGQQFDDHYFGAIPGARPSLHAGLRRQALPLRHPGQDAPQRSRARSI